jgi:hypothetical protein
VGETLLLHPSVLTYQDGNIDDILIVQMFYTLDKNYIDNEKIEKGRNIVEKMGGKNGECSDNSTHNNTVIDAKSDDDNQIDGKVIKKNKKIKKNHISSNKIMNLNTKNNKKNVYVSTAAVSSKVLTNINI